MTALPIASAYRDAIRVALVLQVPVTLLLLLLLDGGRMARIGGCAMAGFWAGAAIVIMRRPRDPKPLDLLYIRWGYVAMLFVGVVAANIIGR